MKTKIFCIGFHKTGTTSLARALQILGYKVTGPNWVEHKDLESQVFSLAHKTVAKYDAFQDNPWPVIYKEMDISYPESKFILTVRDPSKWLDSQLRHFGRAKTPMREWIYGAGCPEGNENVFLTRYNNHNEEVVRYFQGRPADLLVLDFERGDGWDELCSFLGRSVPELDFPHVNKAVDRSSERFFSAFRRGAGLSRLVGYFKKPFR